MERFAEFHFLRPEWLWAMVPAIFFYWRFRLQEDVRSRWKHIIDPDLLDHLVVSPPRRFRVRPIHLLCVVIILASIGAAGPAWDRETPPFTEDKAPLVIAVDLSETMDAIDVQPTRLERVKLKIRDLLLRRQGARTALFVYAGSAHMVLPLTEDLGLIQVFLDSLSTSLMPVPGKDTAAALRSAAEFLQRESIPGTILLVTDGIERAAFPAFAAQRKSARDLVMVLAVGTEEGGPVQAGPGQFRTDRTGRRMFSKVDVEAFRSLKRDEQVPVTMLTLNESDVEWIQRRVQNHMQLMQQAGAEARWRDMGYWLVIPVTLFAALWFRKGWVVRWVASAVLALFSLGAPAQAAGWRFLDLWMTPDQQGRYHFEHGEYAKAAELFHEPMWKGLAYYRASQFSEALNQFALVDSPESWFNQGNCLAKLGKYPQAVQAYDESLRRKPGWPEAEHNRQLVQSLIPPPPKKKDEEEGNPDPNLKPDEVQFDKKGKKGKSGQVDLTKLGNKQLENIWMRNVQTTPGDFLKAKFRIQAEKAKQP